MFAANNQFDLPDISAKLWGTENGRLRKRGLPKAPEKTP